jgi:SPX domain protein involved in polyphosphate accumulation
MKADHRYQRSRYELKYVIDEACARRVRDLVRSYLQRDEHAIPEMRYSYPIYSLYLDGPDLRLYRQTAHGHKNRFKLRVRYYDHEPASPVFFEIKRRVNEVIIKERAVVRRAALHGLLSGRAAPRADCLHDQRDAESYGALKHFCELRGALFAEAKVIVYFEREAWVLPADESVRVTFDRECAAARYAAHAANGDDASRGLRPAQWMDAGVPGVILELKFDDRFPIWMRELVRSCDLYRTTIGKYVQCTDHLPRAPRPFAYATAP